MILRNSVNIKIMNIIKKSFYFFILFSITFQSIDCSAQAEDNRYAVSIFNTPVLNTSDYSSVFGGARGTLVKLDSKGLIREMEFIAFPNTVFEILEVIPKGGYDILKVKTEDYQYNSDLYIDSRFVNFINTNPGSRTKSMPDKTEILKKLNSLEGYGYMWGGNYADGIEKLLEFYKPQTNLTNPEKDLWSLKGVDCSGLIYQATNGSTPRNTSSLIEYGSGLDIKGMSADEISKCLCPLI